MSDFGDWVGFSGPGGAFLLAVIVLWSLFWKGCALWHAARRGEAWWFIAILVINTLGLLEIIYLFGFAKLKAGALLSRGDR
ncbi:MAG: DUF5652 family protein [Xanthobacteraceae bacterium]